MSKVEIRVPVYFEGQSLRASASSFIDAEGANLLYESGLARWSKSGKSLILTRSKEEMPPRATSCHMGPNVTLKAVDGSEFHNVCVFAYQPGAKISNVEPGQHSRQ